MENMEIVDTTQFELEITHENYVRQRKKNAFWAGYLPFEITENPIPTNDLPTKSNSKNKSLIGADIYIRTDSKYAGPLTFGIFSLLGAVLFFDANFNWDSTELFFFLFFLLAIICCILYYYTVPDKNLILNRREGTISFPAFTFGKPFTMAFEKIRLGYGGGAAGSPGPDRLIIIRPTRKQFGYNPFLGGSYFQELSFLVWYMDKNRPLPPGEAFDPFRKKDYQRRKAEGFPAPLFISHIQTHEHKHKWQKERDNHWKEALVINEEGQQEYQIWQSAENIALHGEWKEVVPQ